MNAISVLCIANLHPFDINPTSEKVRCPVCGCEDVRLNTSPSLTVTLDTKEPYAVPVTTWLTKDATNSA
jgi:hypothetical protein